jgi:hypothetical protein
MRTLFIPAIGYMLLWLNTSVIAQNWTVGIPVRQQIIDFPSDIEVTAYCDSMSGQGAEFHIPLPAVTGVSYYVHVDNAIPPTDSFKLIHNGVIKILSLGDSMLIVPIATASCIQFGEPCEIIKISYYEPIPQVNSSFASLKFMAVGTPSVAGQNYPLSSCDAWYNQGIGCLFPHYVAEIDILSGDTCFTTSNTVQSPSYISETPELNAYVYPNPSQGIFNLISDKSYGYQSYTLSNIWGKIVASDKINPVKTSIDIKNMPTGIYILKIGDSVNRHIKVIIE